MRRSGLVNVDLRRADAGRPGVLDGVTAPFDAVTITYALSIIRDWHTAFSLLREGGQIVVVRHVVPDGSMAGLRAPGCTRVRCYRSFVVPGRWPGADRLPTRWPDYARRAATCSATRMALAMMVRVGFTAPMEGMKEPSTT